MFDTRNGVDLANLSGDSTIIRYARGTALPDGYIVRLMPDRAAPGERQGGRRKTGCQLLGDNIADASNQLAVSR